MSRSIADAVALAQREGRLRAILHLIRSGYRPSREEWDVLDAVSVNGGRARERDGEGLTPTERKWITAAEHFRAYQRQGVSDEDAQARTCTDLGLDWDAFDRVLTGRSNLIPILRERGLWPLRGLCTERSVQGENDPPR